MHYKFTGINEPPKQELVFTMRYGNIILDEIEGIRTLSVTGRGNVKRRFNKISNFSSEEDFLLSSKFDPIRLEVALLLKAKNDYAMRNLVDKVSNTFKKPDQKLKFSDETFYYIVSLAEIKFKETQNSVIANLKLDSFSPYKFKDVEIEGNLFNYQTDIPAIPTEIICEVLEDAEKFILQNSNTRQKLVINKKVLAGDKVFIKPHEYFGITINGQNVMPWLTPNSEFEKLEFSFKDVIETEPICKIKTKAQLRKLG